MARPPQRFSFLFFFLFLLSRAMLPCCHWIDKVEIWVLFVRSMCSLAYPCAFSSRLDQLCRKIKVCRSKVGVRDSRIVCTAGRRAGGCRRVDAFQISPGPSRVFIPPPLLHLAQNIYYSLRFALSRNGGSTTIYPGTIRAVTGEITVVIILFNDS